MDHERFLELCRLVSPEKDPERLAALIKRINDLLDIKADLLLRIHLVDSVN
jgi:hypothetical protein